MAAIAESTYQIAKAATFDLLLTMISECVSIVSSIEAEILRYFLCASVNDLHIYLPAVLLDPTMWV